jgi:hypothetical protein
MPKKFSLDVVGLAKTQDSEQARGMRGLLESIAETGITFCQTMRLFVVVVHVLRIDSKTAQVFQLTR